jgi:hypothetical protein
MRGTLTRSAAADGAIAVKLCAAARAYECYAAIRRHVEVTAPAAGK